MTFSQIDRRDIPPIWVAIDWDDNRQVYLSSKDLAHVLQTFEDDLISHCGEGSFVDVYNITFLRVQKVLEYLSSNPTHSRITYWLEKDILPSIDAMPYGTALKL